MGKASRFGMTIAAVLVVALAGIQTRACTLWAAAGTEVAGGGTLLSKNRDWRPDHRQELRLVRPKSGFAYFGLYAVDGSEPGLKAGINERGLTIVSASAEMTREEREARKSKRGVMTRVLRAVASTDEFLARADEFLTDAKAEFLLVADGRRALSVEISPDGRRAIVETTSGVIAHTNHYLAPALAEGRPKIGRSSATRLNRVRALLEGSARPLTLDRFVAIGRDQNDGPDDSLWRTGREHTMASWIVREIPGAAPILRVVIANPGAEEVTRVFTLDDGFWAKGTPSK